MGTIAPTFVILAAATTLMVAAQEISVASPPGRLVDIGGRQIHLHCMGSGSPTVILEAGASSFAIDFALVQPAVANTTRVCSYDRAGHGWSTARGELDTPGRVIADLRSALRSAGEKPPYVMVGASFGAIYVRLKFDERLIALQGASMSAEAIRELAEANRAAFARLLESRPVKDAPMRNVATVVLTRGLDMTLGIAENHAALAALSTNSRHAVVPKSGHEIHLFEPTTVIEAIRDVVASHRSKKPLPPQR